MKKTFLTKTLLPIATLFMGIAFILPFHAYADFNSNLGARINTLQGQLASLNQQAVTVTNQLAADRASAGSFWSYGASQKVFNDTVQLTAIQAKITATNAEIAQLQNPATAPTDQAGLDKADATQQAALSGADSNATAQQAADAALKAKQGSECSNIITGNFLDCIRKGAAYIGTAILNIVSLILIYSLAFFNFSILLTLSISSLAKATAVVTVWALIRDICNIFFIFVMLYIAITTIIDYGKGGMKLLRPLIIAAIFINFSYFIAGAIIDASNIMAVGIYDSISSNSGNSLPATTDYESVVTYSLTSSSKLNDLLLTKLGVQSWFTLGGSNLSPTTSAGSASLPDTSTSGPASSWQDIITKTVLGSILIIIAAFIFAYAGILFFARTITLLFILALSPLAFAGGILPQFQGPSDDWWKALTKQASFAPAFLLVLYVALSFLAKAGLANASTSIVVTIFNYALVIALLVASIKVADEGGGAIGKSAKEWAGWATNGAAAYVGRKTIGYSANRIAKSGFGEALDKIGAGRVRNVLSNIGTNSTFDVRNISALGGNLGKGGKNGFVTERNATIKEKVEQAEMLKPDKAETVALDEKKAVAVTAAKVITDNQTARNEAIGNKATSDKKEATDKNKKESETSAALVSTQAKQVADLEKNLAEKQAQIKKLEIAAGNHPSVEEQSKIDSAKTDIVTVETKLKGEKATLASEETRHAAEEKTRSTNLVSVTNKIDQKAESDKTNSLGVKEKQTLNRLNSVLGAKETGEEAMENRAKSYDLFAKLLKTDAAIAAEIRGKRKKESKEEQGKRLLAESVQEKAAADAADKKKDEPPEAPKPPAAGPKKP